MGVIRGDAQDSNADPACALALALGPPRMPCRVASGLLMCLPKRLPRATVVSGVVGEGVAGWMEAQQQATWESPSSKYL